MHTLKILLIGLAALTSFACMVLLFRGYARKRVRLLLWSGFCFVGLTINNIFVFGDLVLFPDIDLRLPRLISALAGLSCLLYAFIWEAGQKGGQHHD